MSIFGNPSIRFVAGDPMSFPVTEQTGKKPYVCPVCNGTGNVPSGFYSRTGKMWSTTTMTPEPCRSCDGRGVIIC